MTRAQAASSTTKGQSSSSSSSSATSRSTIIIPEEIRAGAITFPELPDDDDDDDRDDKDESEDDDDDDDDPTKTRKENTFTLSQVHRLIKDQVRKELLAKPDRVRTKIDFNTTSLDRLPAWYQTHVKEKIRSILISELVAPDLVHAVVHIENVSKLWISIVALAKEVDMHYLEARTTAMLKST